MEGQHAQNLWEAAIFPALSGFVLCAGLVLFAAWRPAPRPGPWIPLDRHRLMVLVRRSALLVAVGYGTFLVIVQFYSEWLQHEPNGFETAWWSGLFLLGVAIPIWAVLTWVRDRRARQPRMRAPR